MPDTAIPTSSRLWVKSREDGHCLRCDTPTAVGAWHHRRSRSVVDEHRHLPCNGIWLCTTCHIWVHGHPFEAREKGFIVARFAIPCEQPVWSIRIDAWILLGHREEFSIVTEAME